MDTLKKGANFKNEKILPHIVPAADGDVHASRTQSDSG
jgi:hypothetical protein